MHLPEYSVRRAAVTLFILVYFRFFFLFQFVWLAGMRSWWYGHACTITTCPAAMQLATAREKRETMRCWASYIPGMQLQDTHSTSCTNSIIYALRTRKRDGEDSTLPALPLCLRCSQRDTPRVHPAALQGNLQCSLSSWTPLPRPWVDQHDCIR